MDNIKKNIPPNKNLDNFIDKTENSIRMVKGKYNQLQGIINNTPIQVKILNIVVPFILLYIFTIIYYNLPLSILFAIITFFVILLMSKIIAVIYIILYILILTSVIQSRYVTIGEPILQTDIVKNKVPYDCHSTSLVVANNLLPQDLNGGYYTYSFWLYVNGANNEHNWKSYRYNDWKSIFYRGNNIDDSGDLSSLIQFPGFWLTPVLNNMVIVFQNGSYVERLEITNIPFNTWTNFSVVIESKSVSVYVNGLLDRTLNLYQSITIMNGYNLYITNDAKTGKNQKESGFAGSLSELICYNYALSPTDIYKSYVYYKKIMNKYQSDINMNNKYDIPGLITNSDYLSK